MGFLKKIIDKIIRKPKDTQWLNQKPENEPIEPNVTKVVIDPGYEQLKCAICNNPMKNQKYFRCNLCYRQMCAKCLINHKCGGNGSDHYGKITNLGDGRIRYQPKKSGK